MNIVLPLNWRSFTHRHGLFIKIAVGFNREWKKMWLILSLKRKFHWVEVNKSCVSIIHAKEIRNVWKISVFPPKGNWCPFEYPYLFTQLHHKKKEKILWMLRLGLKLISSSTTCYGYLVVGLNCSSVICVASLRLPTGCLEKLVYMWSHVIVLKKCWYTKFNWIPFG